MKIVKTQECGTPKVIIYCYGEDIVRYSFEKRRVEDKELQYNDCKNVTELDEEIKEINSIYSKNMKLEDIPLDDAKTWHAFKTCNTKGVFQFSSPVAIPVLKKMQCSNMEELAAANSFIRPGTGGLDDYVKGKKDSSTIKVWDERIDKWLKPTYGAKYLVPKHGNCWKVA